MRTHYCAALDATHVDERVELTGWVHRRRDHGGVIFLDLRDRTGIVQVVYDPDTAESFATADRVRNEFVLRATGRVRRRPEGMVNPELPHRRDRSARRVAGNPQRRAHTAVPAR